MAMSIKKEVPGIEWSKLSGKYWTAQPDKEYIIEFGNWRIEETQFNNPELPPRNVLVMNVYTLQEGDNKLEEFDPPKEFSTMSYSFIENIRPIIDKAVREGKDRIYVQLKKTGKHQYSIFSVRMRL